MRSYAIPIDGAFLKRKLGTAKDPTTATRIKEFTEKLARHPALVDLVLYRIYYYDAMPFTEEREIPLSGGTRQNFGTTDVAIRNKKLMQAIPKYPFFAARLGETAFRGWAVKPAKLREKGPNIAVTSTDLSPVIGQKGVDMRIGLDIASLTLKRIVQVIVLVTGDSDFVPAMKFAPRRNATFLGHTRSWCPRKPGGTRRLNA